MDSEILQEIGKNVGTEIIANLVWIIIVSAVGYAFFRLKKHLVWLSVGTIKKSAVLLLVAGAILTIPYYFGLITSTTAFAIISVLGPLFGFLMLWRYRRLGIVDAYPSTVDGIDYSDSLKRPRHSFDFLGVGAHKLTSDSNFEDMIKRCASAGRPVKLLLSPPDNPLLQSVAARSGIDKKEYGRRVRESLRKIATLSLNSGFNIQVRFYEAKNRSDFQQFRLVFIDDRLCIFSYTIWDSKEGRSNPQLILDATDRNFSSTGLYYAFRDYFERIWDDENTVEVDLSKYK